VLHLPISDASLRSPLLDLPEVCRLHGSPLPLDQQLRWLLHLEALLLVQLLRPCDAILLDRSPYDKPGPLSLRRQR